MAQKVSLPFSAQGAAGGRARILVQGKERVAVGSPSFPVKHVPFLQLGQLPRRRRARGDGAGPSSVPREPEGLQCHQQGKAMQQIGLQCRYVVNTHTQSKK